ncbi:hypothetical protein [Chondromyces crocatus]|nr:hypothetical protein [Chondromyces crocatus]
MDTLDEPFRSIPDADEREAPPLYGKDHLGRELSDVVPTLDDDVRAYRHHPNEAGRIAFDVNPHAGDAAADLAIDLGSEFLEGATRVQDMSDLHMLHDDQDPESAFLYEEELLNASDEQIGDEVRRSGSHFGRHRRVGNDVMQGDDVELGEDVDLRALDDDSGSAPSERMLKRSAKSTSSAAAPTVIRRAAGQR